MAKFLGTPKKRNNWNISTIPHATAMHINLSKNISSRTTTFSRLTLEAGRTDSWMTLKKIKKLEHIRPRICALGFRCSILNPFYRFSLCHLKGCRSAFHIVQARTRNFSKRTIWKSAGWFCDCMPEVYMPNQHQMQCRAWVRSMTLICSIYHNDVPSHPMLHPSQAAYLCTLLSIIAIPIWINHFPLKLQDLIDINQWPISKNKHAQKMN